MFTVENDKVRVAFDESGNLVELINLESCKNYAGGKPVWRMYCQHGNSYENEILASQEVSIKQNNNTIDLEYEKVIFEGNIVECSLHVSVFIINDEVHWAVKMANNDSNVIINELHFPLIGGCALKPGQKLITSQLGGKRFDDVREVIRGSQKSFPPYYTPEDEFAQWLDAYPGASATCNCFVFADEHEGLYFASYDKTFQYTAHSLRLYGEDIEAGMIKYPNLKEGDSWQCEGFVVSPYCGTWHEASRKYRQWADSWFRPPQQPEWVRKMNGWHRIILKHQYGEVLFPYDKLDAVSQESQDVGVDTLFMHGWNSGGHDNSYPEYVCDDDLGGRESFVEAMQRLKSAGTRTILYSNCRLIDKATDFYKEIGNKICIKDCHGAEIQDAYRFGGRGTYARIFANRTFVVACPSQTQWQQELIRFADLAFEYDCSSIFYDQMGSQERPCFDESHGHAVPYLTSGFDKVESLRKIREHVKKRSFEMAIGIEVVFDAIAAHADYIHSLYGAANATNDWDKNGEKPMSADYIDWWRFTFPEIICSDREIRDDTDIERRVNHALLKGLRTDIEIHRCRKTISATPHYQAYLQQANALRTKYSEFLLEGRYRDTCGFEIDNSEIEARCFTAGERMAVVLTQSHLTQAETTVQVPGYKLSESDGLGEFDIQLCNNGISVILKKHAMAVLVLEAIS